jgi:hypothetical protein
VGRFAEPLIDALVGRLSKISENFPEIFSAALWKVLAKIAVVYYLFVGHVFYDYVVNVAVRIAGKIFLESPQQIETTEKLARQITNEIATNVSVISITFWSCIVVTALFLGFPLLYKAMFRRNLRIFISFNRVREDIAEQLQAFLEKSRFRVSRVPFKEGAEHQSIVQTVTKLLKQAQMLVCIPGPSDSFVGSELFGASLLGQPVILLVSGKDGASPNTTDKRYPAFVTESLVDQGFHPIDAFISFIGGDLRSMQAICSQALQQGPVRRLSAAIALGTAIAFPVLWILCFFAVQQTPTASLARQTAPLEASVAIGSHVFLLALGTSVVALLLVYCLRVLQSQIKQVLARRRARLKIVAAEFRRDDWIELMTELSAGSSIYQAMFDTAPLAHHEAIETAKPA